MAKSHNQSPIYINLTGVYVVPVKADDQIVAGSVMNDVRLPMFEAFLTSLADTTKGNLAKGDYTLSNALRSLVQKTHPSLLAENDIVMEVTSKIDPEKHEVTHSFRITTTPKK